MSDLPLPELVDAARRVAEEVLAPRAQETDQAALVPRSNLEALAEAGLFGIACTWRPDGFADRPHAGLAAGRGAAMRQVQEALAGACGATYFVWAQHHSPVRRLGATPNSALRERWLNRLCRGDAMAGVAFAYLRRAGPPSVRAHRVAGGWRVEGVAPFVTSWGLADVFVVAALSSEVGEGEQIVWFCLAGLATDAVIPSPPTALAVLQSTSTVVLQLNDLFVPDDDVVGLEPMNGWRARDRLATAQPSAAAFGLAERCCQLLAVVATDREGSGSGPVTEASQLLADELSSCRNHAYALADTLAGAGSGLPVDTAMPEPDDPPGRGTPRQGPTSGGGGSSGGGGGGGGGGGDDGGLALHLEEMVKARTWGLDLAQRASLALVAAIGGRAMALAHPAQRLVREAAFYSVQAQTGPMRASTLHRLTHPPV